jgi:hypothetical protein
VAAGLGQEAADEGPLLRAHADVDRAVDRLNEQPAPSANEGLPGLWIEGVVGDPPPAGVATLAAVIAEADVVRRVGEGHVGPPPAAEPLVVARVRRIAT